QVDHPAGHATDEFPHVGIPLEMQAPDRACPGETLIHLDESDPAEALQSLVTADVALAVMLGEEPAVIMEPREPDHGDLRDGELGHLGDLHGLSSCLYRHRCRGPVSPSVGIGPLRPAGPRLASQLPTSSTWRSPMDADPGPLTSRHSPCQLSAPGRGSLRGPHDLS